MMSAPSSLTHSSSSMLVILLISLLSVHIHYVTGDSFSDLQVQRLTEEVQSLSQQRLPTVHIWKQILELQPRHSMAHVHIGLHDVGNPMTMEQGFQYLQKSIDSEFVDEPVSARSPQYFLLAHMVGRWRIQEHEYHPALDHIQKARNANPEDCICTDLMLASMVNVYPESVKAADESMQRYHKGMDALLERASKESDGRLHLRTNWIGTIPGAPDDYYDYCMNSLFVHSFYYREEVVVGTSKHFQVTTKIWPELIYVTPKLENERSLSSTTQQCIQRKIRLGVASGHFSSASSVSADFRGVLRNLSRDTFEITFIYIKQLDTIPDDVMLDERDKHIVIKKSMDDIGGMHQWLDKPRKDIEALDLDIFLYLDLTMSSHAHRLAMSRLAPVQAVSHGHPITSGFPRSIMNYYISWAGAELPLEQAQTHYTEELKLLPSHSLHQYYDRRILDNDVSAIDNMSFKDFVSNGRSSFPQVDPNGTWYLNMQKPFKLHPEFDYMLCGIVNIDPLAHLILHEEKKESNRNIFIKRLTSAGCDMNRIFFVSVLPHHKLLALYTLSDVILDSYPAGGCTTTREVLELGKVMVTLPAKYLGSRWSIGYYNILGNESLNDLVIANDMDEYIQKASRLGMNKNLRSQAEELIKANLSKLFHSMEAVHQWTKVLLDISPVKIDNGDGMCSHHELMGEL